MILKKKFKYLLNILNREINSEMGNYKIISDTSIRVKKKIKDNYAMVTTNKGE